MSGRKKDSAAKDFFGMGRNYVSLCNGILHAGNQVIKPDDLLELDGTERMESINEKNRDLVRLVRSISGGNVLYRIVGIESQSYDDRMMVLRNLTYDVARYDRQYRKLRHRNRTEKVAGVDRCSGVRKDDTLHPVITGMVNLTGEPWKSPRRLSELFSIDDPEILKYGNDYEMVVVDPYVMSEEELGNYTGEVGTLFSLLRFRDDREAHSRYIMTLRSENESVSSEAWRMLKRYAGFSQVQDDKVINEEGKVVISKAIESRVEMAVKEAVLRTRQEDRQKMEAEQAKMQAEYIRIQSEQARIQAELNAYKARVAAKLGVSVEEAERMFGDACSDGRQ